MYVNNTHINKTKSFFANFVVTKQTYFEVDEKHSLSSRMTVEEMTRIVVKLLLVINNF